MSGSVPDISLMEDVEDASGEGLETGIVAVESGAMGTRGVDVPEGEGVTTVDPEGEKMLIVGLAAAMNGQLVWCALRLVDVQIYVPYCE